MSVRFVIGRAGTGKTHHCVESVRAALRADAVCGPRLVFLVPEQAGLQMERAIIDPAGGVAGAHRADVVSFQRLAVRVLADARGVERVALTEPARAMVIRRLLAERATELKYYSRTAHGRSGTSRVVGLVDRLSRSISELIEEGVDPSELIAVVGATGDESAAAGKMEAGGTSSPAQQAKMHDLALIYRAYLDHLGDRLLDPAQRLDLAREHLPACDWLRGAHVWVDGFASFSGLELATLMALCELAASVDITILADPTLAGAARNANGATSDAVQVALFSKTARLHRDLRRSLAGEGLDFDAPLVLTSEVPARFAEQPALARLERKLFAESRRDAAVRTDVGDAVRLVEASSRRVEVDYAVAQVCRWVQDASKGYRYRDVAIVTRDLTLYHDLLSEALTARQIPYFVDRRRPVSHHPLVELLRTSLAIVVEGMSLGSVREWLKCGLVPLPDDALDELENYLLAHGVEGVPAWSSGSWQHDRLTGLDKRRPVADEKVEAARVRVNAARGRVWALLEAWIGADCVRQPALGAVWHEAIVSLLDRLGAGEQLAAWTAEAEADGDLDLAEEHREVWKQVGSLIDDFRFSFADQTLSVVDVRDVLEAGLSQMTLGLTPPMIDQVLVGSIERSRHPSIKCVIVVGLNDGVFPQKPSEDSILNDEDRELLLDGGVRVGLPARRCVVDESMLAYIAMTRASEHVVVTFATVDGDGKALRASPYVQAIMDAVPGLACVSIDDPARDRSCWDVLSGCDLPRRLAQEFRERPPLPEDTDTAARTTWNDIYTSNRDRLSPSDRRSLSTLDDRPDDTRLDPALVARCCGVRLSASVSSLETYATCPFKYFAKQMLRLRERQQKALAATDTGTVHHAVLEDFIERVIARDASVGTMSEEELVAGLNESCQRISDRLGRSDVVSGARDAYMLSRSAAQLGRVVGAQRRAIQCGKSKVRRAEAAFGFSADGAFPALTIHTPNGHRAELRGFIDRVDLAEVGDEYLGIVVDYKGTKDKKLKLSEVYHGLSLQLLGYLLVLAEHGKTLAGRPIKPGGALYVGLTPQYRRVDHPNQWSERDAALCGLSKPRGLLSESVTVALDPSHKEGPSRYYQVSRSKKTGNLSDVNRSDAACDDVFDATLEHVRTKMGELVDSILDGAVPVMPYRLGTFSPCSWCEMSSVCRFEVGVSDVRRLDSLSKKLVLDRISAGGGLEMGDGAV